MKKRTKITKKMAEDIANCMNAKVSSDLIMMVVRGYRVAITEKTRKRDQAIFTHFEHISAIERRHRDDCDEEIREYIKSVQKINKLRQ